MNHKDEALRIIRLFAPHVGSKMAEFSLQSSIDNVKSVAKLHVQGIIDDYRSYRVKPWIGYGHVKHLTADWEKVLVEIDKLQL